MAVIDELLSASFRGVPFLVDSSSTTSGRKTVTHEYPNSDNRYVEDLGLLNKDLNFQATITGPFYKQKRDALISALEKKGAGLLVHPLFGIQNVVAKPYTLEERMTSLGEATFTLNFQIAQDSILPKPVNGTLSNIFSEINKAINLLQTTVIQVMNISNSDNFLDALNKTAAFLGTVSILTNEYVTESEQFDTFGKQLNNFTDNASQILTDTTVLSQNISNTFTTLDDALSSPNNSSGLFQGLFDFGDSDVIVDIPTAKNLEKQDNRNILNGSIQTLALLMNYRNVVQLDFLTINEIDRQRKILDDQFEKVIKNVAINRSNKSSLVSARNQVREFFDKESLTAFRIEDYQTTKTTITELTYRLYGNFDNIQNLIDLNKFRDLSHISGTVKILTN